MAIKNKTVHSPSPPSQPHTPASSRVKWWRHPRAKTMGLIVIGVGLLVFLGWFLFFRPYLSTNDARIAATTVQVAPPGAGGMVVSIKVTEGDRVRRGDVLVELDHRSAQAQLQRAQARLELAAKEFKRMEQMAAGNGISPQQLDAARANFQTMAADAKLAEIALDNTYLRSPLDGVVIQRSTEVGDMLDPGQTAVWVTDIDHAWVSANIEETSIGLLKIGQPVTVHVDAGGTYSGRVAEIRAATASQFALIPADNPSGNFTKLVQRVPVKVTLIPPDGHRLRVGESVEIKIKIR